MYVPGFPQSLTMFCVLNWAEYKLITNPTHTRPGHVSLQHSHWAGAGNSPRYQ